MGVVMNELGTLLGPINSLPSLAELVGNLFCLYSASPRMQNDHLYSAPPGKNNLFWAPYKVPRS